MEELEEAVVLKRSRASSLSEVRSLQCWGMSIERVSWQHAQDMFESFNIALILE